MLNNNIKGILYWPERGIMKSKYVLLSVSLAMTIALAGCSANTTTTDETITETVTNEVPYYSQTVIGQITEIENEQATVVIGTVEEFASGNFMGIPSGEVPSGEAPSGEAPSGEAPGEAMPDGEIPSGEMPAGGMGEMPDYIFTEGTETYTFTLDADLLVSTDGEMENASSVSELTVDDVIQMEFDESGNIIQIMILNATSMNGMGEAPEEGMSGQAQGVDSYTALQSYDEDTTLENLEITSTGSDENAILIQNGATVELNNLNVERISEDSTGGDNASFYGVGAAVLVTEGTAYVDGGTYTTDAAGGAGIFSYADGIAYVRDAIINTTQNTSGGIHVAGGGTLYAWDLEVETSGESSAAIRSDRGSGIMIVDGGTYISNGVGSPAVYCTADITINDATLVATGSEGVCIEGLNTLRLFETTLQSNMPENEQNDCTWSIILYQSMSGDSEVGNSTFEMTGGSIESENGGLFYTTNTECTITLKEVDITTLDSYDFFLMCTGNTNARGWGTSGSNGSDCLFTGINQTMVGDVIWDSISNLDFYITENSKLTGSFIQNEDYAGAGGSGYANVYISEDSTWIVTGDSTVTSLSSKGSILDESGKTVSVVGSDGTVYVTGTSEYTITVENYSDTVDLSGAGEVTSFSDYEQEQPEAFL